VPGSQFDRELKSVIFSHVEENKKLGASSLDELLAFTNEPIEARIEDLRAELQEINVRFLTSKNKALINSDSCCSIFKPAKNANSKRTRRLNRPKSPNPAQIHKSKPNSIQSAS